MTKGCAKPKPIEGALKGYAPQSRGMRRICDQECVGRLLSELRGSASASEERAWAKPAEACPLDGGVEPHRAAGRRFPTRR
jgi:hypothetical protein